MALAYLAISVPVDKNNVERRSSSAQATHAKKSDTRSQSSLNRADQVARKFFRELDANKDGEVLRAETPISFRAFGFRTFDRNQDEKLTWDDVLYQARLSLRP